MSNAPFGKTARAMQSLALILKEQPGQNVSFVCRPSDIPRMAEQMAAWLGGAYDKSKRVHLLDNGSSVKFIDIDQVPLSRGPELTREWEDEATIFGLLDHESSKEAK